MKLIFLVLQQLFLARLGSAYGVNYVRMWNNQLEDLLNGKDVAEFALYNEAGNTPPLFVEFPDEIEYKQLGNGVQTVDPLDISIHVLHDFYDAQNGTMEQNLAVLDLIEAIYQSIQEYMPNTVTIDNVVYQVPLGVMIRMGEVQDKNHPSVYHFILKFRTSWMDSKMNRPVNGQLAPDTTTLETNIVIE